MEFHIFPGLDEIEAAESLFAITTLIYLLSNFFSNVVVPFIAPCTESCHFLFRHDFRQLQPFSNRFHMVPRTCTSVTFFILALLLFVVDCVFKLCFDEV